MEAQNHPPNKWQSLDSNPDHLMPSSTPYLLPLIASVGLARVINVLVLYPER